MEPVIEYKLALMENGHYKVSFKHDKNITPNIYMFIKNIFKPHPELLAEISRRLYESGMGEYIPDGNAGCRPPNQVISFAFQQLHNELGGEDE